MTLDRLLFSAKCLAKSSRFSLFKKSTSSAELVGAAWLCLLCPVLAQDSPVPVSEPCFCWVCLSSCRHDGTASVWLSPWLTQTWASDLYLHDSAAWAHDPKTSGSCLSVTGAHSSQYPLQALLLTIQAPSLLSPPHSRQAFSRQMVIVQQNCSPGPTRAALIFLQGCSSEKWWD